MGDVDQTVQRTRARALILLVEDDADHRGLLAELLLAHGYAVVTAGDGKDALAALRDFVRLPSAIVMDLRMPVMTGWELLEALARHAPWSTIPVLVLSATPNARPIASGQVVAKLTKPADVELLLSGIEHACSLEARGSARFSSGTRRRPEIAGLTGSDLADDEKSGLG